MCLIEDGHKAHELTTIPKIAKKYHDLLSTYLQSATTNQENLIKENKDLLEKKTILAKNFNQLLKDFSVVFEVIRKILNEKEAEIIGRLQKIIDEEIENLNAKGLQFSKLIENIEDFKREVCASKLDNEVDFVIGFLKKEGMAKAVTAKLQVNTKSDPFSAVSIEGEISGLLKVLQQKFFSKAEPKSAPVKKKSSIGKEQGKGKLNTKPSNKTIPKPVPTFDWQNISAISKVHSDEDTISMKSFDFHSLYKMYPTKIFTVSGFSDKVLLGMEMYDSHTDIWTDLSNCINPRTQFSGLHYLNNFLILGGKQGGKRISSCENYDFASNVWSPSPISLPVARSGFGSIGLSSNFYLDDIYIVGGNNGTVLNTFEMFNMDQWISLPSMNTKRDELSAVVGPDLNIYAIGGYGGDSAVLDSAEVYYIETEKWEFITPMGTPKRALSVISLPDGIYAVGGYDGSSYLKDLEKYEYRMKKWVNLAPMKYPRCTLSCVGNSQYIYAIGGFNGTALGNVERYSVAEDKWEEISPMRTPRFMHCSLAISESLNNF